MDCNEPRNPPAKLPSAFEYLSWDIHLSSHSNSSRPSGNLSGVVIGDGSLDEASSEAPAAGWCCSVVRLFLTEPRSAARVSRCLPFSRFGIRFSGAPLTGPCPGPSPLPGPPERHFILMLHPPAQQLRLCLVLVVMLLVSVEFLMFLLIRSWDVDV